MIERIKCLLDSHCEKKYHIKNESLALFKLFFVTFCTTFAYSGNKKTQTAFM